MGPDGNFYVSSGYTQQVLRYNGETGEFMDVFASGHEMQAPSAVGFGPDGNLYVSSQVTACVLRFDGNTGAFIDTFIPAGSGGLQRPTWFVFGPDGYFYLSCHYTDRVLRYNAQTGAFVDEFVPAGYGGLDGPTGLVLRTVPDPINQPPSQPVVEIAPDPPTTEDDLICHAGGSIDPEGMPVLYSYAWFRDGDLVENESSFTLNHSLTSTGETGEPNNTGCAWLLPATGRKWKVEGAPGSDSVTIRKQMLHLRNRLCTSSRKTRKLSTT